MPEYLAPAVYVEEVSFRSKPLEGVSTSTTAFVGPTSTGPINDVPELITGVGDFERVYGATTRLGFGLNHLAHAVRAFFDNGGRRLYVARTFDASGGTGVAEGAPLPGEAAPNARFVARFPGAAGDGRIELREQRVRTSSTNRTPLERAPIGTMIRTGTESAATPATVRGNRAPFFVPDSAAVRVTVGAAAPVTVVFRGDSARVSSGALDFSSPLVVTASSAPLQVQLGGVTQRVNVPGTYTTIQTLADALNRALVGGFVVVAGNTLTLGSEVRGRASSVTIVDGGVYGFAAGATDSRAASTDTVPNLGRVTAEDLAQLLSGLAVSVTVDAELRVNLSTLAVGEGPDAALVLENDGTAPSAANALGFALGTVEGDGSTPVTIYVKRETGYQTASGASLPNASANLGGVEFLSLNVVAIDGEGFTKNFEELAYSPDHPRYIGSVLAASPPRRSDALENRFALSIDADESILAWPFTLRNALLGGASEAVRTLSGGNDGAAPSAPRFEEALERLLSIEDISIVAAPGSSDRPDLDDAKAIRSEIITFVERRRSYQIAVLDTPPQQTVDQARDYRGEIDSKYAALYYPWVRISNPDQRPGDITIPREIDVPPSGFLCGIYARNDAERGVHKAPANEIVRGALSLETYVNFAQQEVLNPSGINALRFFPGRGFRVWGARVATSDPEWKYVSLRRYFNFIEASIDRGTQWVVFEPNGPRLWQRVRSTVSDFLFNEWRNGALLGNAPAEAFFVRADRTTMTQNDIDNGRLIVEVGIAPVNPAEFVIFRIGQKTADGRS